MKKKGFISSPGRICLFGEHQDYLGLPVIPMAIDRRLRLHYQLHEGSNQIELQSNQLKYSEKFSFTHPPQLISSPYNYQKAVIRYFWNDLNSLLPSKIVIDSKIPIRAGLSSSAALLTAMVFLFSNIILNQNLDLKKIAEIAYYCEHDILGISCGRMDQYASSLGQIFHMTPQVDPKITPLHLTKEAYFVLGNSGIERNADIPLKTVQQDILKALRSFGNLSISELNLDDVKIKKLSKKFEKRLLGVIGIRDNTIEAFGELKRKKLDLSHLGSLISAQQTFLRDNYGVSTLKLDKMCEISEQNGALGAKLTGAGFGGCMFAMTNSEKISFRIKEKLQDYGESFITRMDTGISAH